MRRVGKHVNPPEDNAKDVNLLNTSTGYFTNHTTLLG